MHFNNVLAFCIIELSHTPIYRRQTLRQHPDSVYSVYTAKHVIHMRLKKRELNMHHNKVEIIH